MNNKKYKIIYADPPWNYRNGGVPQGGVDKQYPTMKIEDIKNLQINKLADDDCVLMMWATFPQLQQALDVIKSWGFEYKTLGFSWLKTNKDGSPFFGIGYYAKSNQEVCLLATKGKAHSLVKSNSVSSFVSTKRTKHSEKPQIFRDKIIELFGDIPRIELFARRKIDGWDCIGNEINGQDIKEVIEML